MKIIKAKRKHLKEIAKLFRIIYSEPPYNEKWSTKTAHKRVKDYYKQSTIFILIKNSQIKGFIMGYNYQGEKWIKGFIHEFGISKEERGKGYGKELYKTIMKHLRKKGAKQIEVIADKTSQAYKIYRKWGFKKWPQFVYLIKRLK